MANLIENDTIEQVDFAFQRISSQVERVLFSLDFIAGHRSGVSLDDVYQSQNERFGTCRRTAKRDLSTMVAVNIVLVKKEDKQQIFSVNPTLKLGRLLLSNSTEIKWDFWILCEDERVVLIRENVTYEVFIAACSRWKLKNVRPFLSPRPLPLFTVIHPED